MAKFEFKFPISSFRGLIKFGENVKGLVFCDGAKRKYVRTYTEPDPNREVSEAEQRNRETFKNGVVLWKRFMLKEKELYKKYAYYATKNKSCGWNEFVKDYIRLAHKYNLLELDRLFRKAFDFWSYEGDVEVAKQTAFKLAVEYLVKEGFIKELSKGE